MTNKLDIVGIGNAMVDAIIPSNKEEVEKNNLNREKLKVNGPIEPIPVVCETKAVPHIKVAISIKKFARV